MEKIDKRFFNALQNLGKIKRTGWIMAKIPYDMAESIAEHTLKVAFIALKIAKETEGADQLKTLKMALIHDLPEAVTSDIPKPIKEKMNGEKMKEVTIEALNNITCEKELREIHKEYIKGESVEAKIVEYSDRLATNLQSETYIKEYGIRTEYLKEIYENSRRILERMKKNEFKPKDEEI